MKRKSYGATPVKVIKTSISLPEVLLRFGEERCGKEGFNSFSAYVAHLVRMDKEKKEAGGPVDRGTAPHIVNETPTPTTNSTVEDDLSAEIISHTEAELAQQEKSSRKKKSGAPQK